MRGRYSTHFQVVIEEAKVKAYYEAMFIEGQWWKMKALKFSCIVLEDKEEEEEAPHCKDAYFFSAQYLHTYI